MQEIGPKSVLLQSVRYLVSPQVIIICFTTSLVQARVLVPNLTDWSCLYVLQLCVNVHKHPGMVTLPDVQEMVLMSPTTVRMDTDLLVSEEEHVRLAAIGQIVLRTAASHVSVH